MNTLYEEFIKELPIIAEKIKMFPAELQKDVLCYIVAEYDRSTQIFGHNDFNSHNGQGSKSHNANNDLKSDGTEFTGVACITDAGYTNTIRDLKAKSAADAIKRLVYVTAYTHKILTGSPLSRKDVLNPILKKWRLQSGNSRGFISGDRGLLKNGDLLELDEPAKLEAKTFIEEIQNPDIKGSWIPNNRPRKKNKDKK